MDGEAPISLTIYGQTIQMDILGFEYSVSSSQPLLVSFPEST